MKKEFSEDQIKETSPTFSVSSDGLTSNLQISFFEKTIDDDAQALIQAEIE